MNKKKKPRYIHAPERILGFKLSTLMLLTSSLHDSVKHVGCDIFQSVPKADAAFISWVSHDWGDKECVKIQRTARKLAQL